MTLQDLAARWRVTDKTAHRWTLRWPDLLRPVKFTARSPRWTLRQVERFERHMERANAAAQSAGLAFPDGPACRVRQKNPVSVASQPVKG